MKSLVKLEPIRGNHMLLLDYNRNVILVLCPPVKNMTDDIWIKTFTKNNQDDHFTGNYVVIIKNKVQNTLRF